MTSGDGGWSQDPWSDDEDLPPGRATGPANQNPTVYGPDTPPGTTAGPYGQGGTAYDPAPSGYGAGQTPYGAGSAQTGPASFGPGAGSGPGPGSAGGSKKLLLAVLAAVVVLAGGIGTAVALTSTKHPNGSGPTTTVGPTVPATTSPTSPSSTTTSPPSTTTPPSPNSNELISNVPFSNCANVSADARTPSDSTSEVACDGSDVSGDGAALVFYSALPTAEDATGYLATLNTSGVDGPCDTVHLGTGEVTCAFTDDNDESGDAVMAIGDNFTFSSTSTAEDDCADLGASSVSGTSELVWNYTGSDVVGIAISCEDDSTTPLSYMREALYDNYFELDNQ